MSLGTNLKHWRQVRGLTQPELAERAEIEQSYLSKLENDRSQASEGVLDRLATALEIDLDTLQRDPTRNGQLKKAVIAAALVLGLLGSGFYAGYSLSDYEVRKVSKDAERVATVWSLAPDGVHVMGVGSYKEGLQRVHGRFAEPEDSTQVQVYAARLLREGVLGTELEEIFITPENKHFSITIKGDPVESQHATAAEPAE
ncbi:MAG: helix-turn-helix transcriptional regulator [Gammaproteobacteria bacterium]|nr:helix-turn-helix transcriptional regulator [Gammaproteobacteria bacterium]